MHLTGRDIIFYGNGCGIHHREASFHFCGVEEGTQIQRRRFEAQITTQVGIVICQGLLRRKNLTTDKEFSPFFQVTIEIHHRGADVSSYFDGWCKQEADEPALARWHRAPGVPQPLAAFACLDAGDLYRTVAFVGENIGNLLCSGIGLSGSDIDRSSVKYHFGLAEAGHSAQDDPKYP